MHEVHQDRHKCVHGERDEGLLRGNDEHLAQLVERGDLANVITVVAKTRQDLFQSAIHGTSVGKEIFQAAAKPP